MKSELELAKPQFPSALFSGLQPQYQPKPEKVVMNSNRKDKTSFIEGNKKNCNKSATKSKRKMKNSSSMKKEVEMVINYIPDVDGFYDRLIEEAPYIPGDSMALIPVTEIPWANRSLMKEGVKFAMRNFFPLLIANTAALMGGFSVKPDSAVLLRSGKFSTQESSFLRYLSTGKRIGDWFTTDLSDMNSKGFKQIQAVRKLHAYYAKSKNPFPTLKEMGWHPEMKILLDAIHEDLADLEIPDAPTHLLTWDPPLPFSQFDVAMTQFGFIGLIYLYPEAMGVGYEEFLDGFLHFWAVIGRLLGLEDRFNLALHCNDKDKAKALFKKLYDNIAMASLKSTDERVICLQYSLMDGLRQRLPWLSLKGWIYYGLKEQSDHFEGTQIWDLMGIRDKAFYYWLKWTLAGIRNSKVFRFIITAAGVILLHLSYWIYLPKGCPMM